MRYAVVGNRAVFEGDIVLGTVDELVSRSAELDSASLATGPSRAVVVVGAQFRWPNALMPYAISAALPNRARVTDAIAHWGGPEQLRVHHRTHPGRSSHRQCDGLSAGDIAAVHFIYQTQ